jgi:hypothetical protein
MPSFVISANIGDSDMYRETGVEFLYVAAGGMINSRQLRE